LVGRFGLVFPADPPFGAIARRLTLRTSGEGRHGSDPTGSVRHRSIISGRAVLHVALQKE